MALRKYAQDYTLEIFVDHRGRKHSRRIYQGAVYAFVQPPEVVRRLRWMLLSGGAGIGLLLLPLLLSNTGISRTAWVILPAALALAPLALLLAGAWRLGNGEKRMTRQQRDQSRHRISGGCVWLVILLGIACAGCWIYRIQPEEWHIAASLHGALAVCGLLLPHRKKAATKEI